MFGAPDAVYQLSTGAPPSTRVESRRRKLLPGMYRNKVPYLGLQLMNSFRPTRRSGSRSSSDVAIKQGEPPIVTTPAPRTLALLTSFLYRAAGDLGAAAINARSTTEADHASKGRALCVEMFIRLAPAATADARADDDQVPPRSVV